MLSLLPLKKNATRNERLKAAFEIRKKRPADFDDIFGLNREDRKRPQDWKVPNVQAQVAALAISLEKKDPHFEALRAAFKAAGLNSRNPHDWRKLIELFALAHFEPVAKRGMRQRWYTQHLCALLKDFANIQKKRTTRLSDTAACISLAKKTPYKERNLAAHTIRKMLYAARDVKRNPLLADEYKRQLRKLSKAGGTRLDNPHEALQKQAKTAAIKTVVERLDKELF